MNIYDQEKALLEGLAANDKNAIETIYRENYTMIQSFIVKNNGYPDDARDIFQEAMIVLFEKAKSEFFCFKLPDKNLFVFSLQEALA